MPRQKPGELSGELPLGETAERFHETTGTWKMNGERIKNDCEDFFVKSVLTFFCSWNQKRIWTSRESVQLLVPLPRVTEAAVEAAATGAGGMDGSDMLWMSSDMSGIW